MTPRAEYQPVLQAASTWATRCLRDQTSVFSDDPLWTAGPIEQLKRDFVDNPDLSDRNFLEKLEKQLEPTSPDGRRLAAEMLWVMMLFPSNITQRTKAALVINVWSWSGSTLPADHQFLTAALQRGIGSTGISYNNRRWAELAFFIEFMHRWVALSPEIRSELLSAPYRFAHFLDETPGADRRQLRHALLFLLFPDVFQRVSSASQRELITQHFAGLVKPDELGSSADDSPMLVIDRKLSQVLAALAKKNGRDDVDFYDSDIEPEWKGDLTKPGAEPRLAALTRLPDVFSEILAGYVDARENDRFSSKHRISKLFAMAKSILQSSRSTASHPGVTVRASAGQGNWARVPWVALLDQRETSTTQRGVYCVFLFRADMSGLYVTLNQGVTEPLEQFGNTAGLQRLHERAVALRKLCTPLADHGFRLDDKIDLRAPAGLGSQYESATVAHKLYLVDELPDADELTEDLEALLDVYEAYVEGKKADLTPPARNAWIFQANPDLFDIQGALGALVEISWLVRQNADKIREGDEVFFWQAGRDAGIVATGTLLTDAASIAMPVGERAFVKNDAKFDGDQLRVHVQIERKLATRISREHLLQLPALEGLSILRAAQGTNFAVTREQASLLRELIAEADSPGIAAPPSYNSLADICHEFSSALRLSHLEFGVRHDELVRGFLASLSTKRFCILTGLSGSGKSQLALKLGEWFGTGRFLALPVRPDWTSPEAILGFEDALIQPVEGRGAWHTPDALSFILRARADLHSPYLLLLDEMNLAHVERYFADILSGMESDEPCLPPIVLEDGVWRKLPDGSPRIRLPDNLFVVGTVNVDETTYMFSPKVLDRANTIEFRVETDDLRADAIRPSPCLAGSDASVRGLLSVARDTQWHINNPPPYSASFISAIIRLHALLCEHDLEFGHRSFYDAIRFSAVYAAAGGVSAAKALDLVVLQKVLPRMHGPRRRLETPLVALLAFSQECGLAPRGDVEGDAGVITVIDLPGSHRKIERMLNRVRTDQFASFLA
jgi:hypothetical protein